MENKKRHGLGGPIQTPPLQWLRRSGVCIDVQVTVLTKISPTARK